MGDLHESVRVACPFASAEVHFDAYLEGYGPDASGAHFNMRLEPRVLSALGLSGEDRGVNVAIRSLPSGTNDESRYRIRWMPEKSGPHTLFLGEIALERSAEPEDDSFALRLDGRYEIPRDAPPRDLEGVYAKRVALATAAALLGSIETFVARAAASERTRVSTNGVTHGYGG